MYVKYLPFLRQKGDKSKCFKIDRGVRQGFVILLWLFNVYMVAAMEGVKIWMRRMGVKFLE